MNKFFILLKKETKELLTPQMVIPFILVVVVFGVFGKISSKEAEKSQSSQKIVIVNQDKSGFATQAISQIDKAGLNTEVYDNNTPVTEVIETYKKKGNSAIIVIPNGFGSALQKSEPIELETYSIISNFSFTAARNFTSLQSAVGIINNYSSDIMIAAPGISKLSPAELKNPVRTKSNVTVGKNTAITDANQVLGYVSSQTAFIPIILFLVIVLASQMIATAVAAEKENKTLETLLSMPVSRKMIVSAKMIAAGLVSLILAGVYIYGFRSYMTDFGGLGASSGSQSIQSAVDQLGLIIGPSGYAMLGLSLFFGILAALAISIILGGFADDIKSVQGVVTPLMVLVMISYFSVLMLDVNSLSPAFRYVIYAIPFSHPFLAMPNLYLQNYSPVIWGIVYQALLFIVFVWIAARVFSTDKIITMRLNFNKKKR